MSRSGSNQKRRPQSKPARSTARTRSNANTSSSHPLAEGRVVAPSSKNIFPADSDISSDVSELTAPACNLSQPNVTNAGQANYDEQPTHVRQNLGAKDNLARLTRAPLSMPDSIKGIKPELLFGLLLGSLYGFVTAGAWVVNNFKIPWLNLAADLLLLALIDVLFVLGRTRQMRRRYRFGLLLVQMTAWFATVLIMPRDFTIFFTIIPFYTLIAEIQFLFRTRIATVTALGCWLILLAALATAEEPTIRNASLLILILASVPFAFVAVVSRFVIREGRQRRELITALTRLKGSEERYRLVTVRANDAIYILDADGRFSFVNPKMCEVTGWQMQELLGQHFTSILPPELRAASIEGYQKAELEHRPSDNTIVIDILRKDRKMFTAEINSSLIFEGAQLQGRVGVARDISERQRMREEMDRRNRDLTALNAVIGTAGSSLELDKVLNDVVNTLVEVLGADVAGITLKEEGTRLLKVAAYKGASDMVVRAVTTGTNDNSIGAGNLTRSVVESGEPLLIGDMTCDPRVPVSTVREIGLRSFAAAPIKSRDSVIGVLSLISHQRCAFDQADLNLLASIGSQLAVAIENARLYGTSLNQVRELMCLAEIARAINLAQSLSQTLSNIAESICNTLDYAAGAVYLLDSNLQGITSYGSHSLPERFVEDLNKLMPAWAKGGEGQDSNIFKAIQTKAPAISFINENKSVQSNPQFQELFTKLGWKTIIAVPLLQQGQVLGVISCYSREETPPPESELRLLTTIANQTVVAVQNARLYREQQRRADQLRAVSEIGQKIGSILSVDELLPFMTRLLHQTFDYYLVAVFLLDQNKPDELVLRSTGGWDNQFQQTPRYKLAGPGILAWVTRAGIAQIVPDVSKDPRYMPGPGMESVRSELSVPIRVGGDIVGVLDVQSTVINGFDEIDMATMTVMAEQVGIALANAKLYQEQRRRAEQLRTVNEITQKIGSILSLEDLLPYVTRLLCDNFYYDHASIFLVDEPSNQLVLTALADIHAEHVTDGWVGERIDLNEASIVTQAANTGQSLLVNNVGEWYKMELHPPYDLNGQSTAELCVPIRSGGEVVGVLDIASHQLNIFDETDRATAQTLADQVGIAIENARLYTKLNRIVEQLKAANSDLEDATRHKSEFLANMSHELRTPLNAIIGFSEVLQDQMFGDLNSRQTRYVGNILTSGRHLLNLVNDVLDLSKVEAGKMELHPEAFVVNEAIGDVENIVVGMVNKKRLNLSKQLEAELAPIVADKSKFKQILYNLLSNAVKFTPEGGAVTVCSRLQTANPQHTFLEVSVSDTGIGIRREDQEHIFEEFRQVDSSYSRQFQGTGLGLALSRRLVELHGGKLWVESQPGRGSTFTFSLPLVPAENKKSPSGQGF